ncbi:putative OPA3-like protein CG13603 [Macrosteles quadrilineatus]|uniref:putative OPA3-like protein CG13603 n=1 Tax=Macrosteles quadrilineatus TaxID=74068 RepID=UPI0023E12FAF|nr:putative OPA3-like protein CG13603 [Macrosteles quadrilineatus]
MKMWVMNLGKPVNIPKLNEAMAIELGASLLGEFIIFSIAAGLLLAEYSRQVRKETAKEAARQEELSNIQYTIQELYFQAERQDTQIRELLRTVSDLESRVVKVPWKGKPSDDTTPSVGLPHPDTRPGVDSIHDIRYYHREGFGTPSKTSYWWPESHGLVFTAVAYLSKDVFRESSHYSVDDM